jgi:O-antigen/teichoic acid export membrane protein
MQIRDYLTSPAGRFATGSLAFALIAGGLIILADPGKHAAWLIPLACVLAACGFIASIGLSLERFHNLVLPKLLLLPVLAGLYFVSLRKLVGGGAGVGVLAMALGYVVAVLTWAKWKLIPEKEAEEKPATDEHARAGHH